MKKFCPFLTVLFITTIAFSQTGPSPIDVQHYNFSLLLSDSTDIIKGKATISVLFLQPSNSFQLDLVSRGTNGKGMKVTKIIAGDKELSFEHNHDTLTIQFTQKVEKNDIQTVEIDYEGIPDDGLIIAKNKFNHRTFFSDNWPNRAHHWLPCNDRPGDKASVEFVVTAPIHYQVVSNGILVEESNVDSTLKITHWKEDLPLPTKVMVIGVADFAVNYAGNIDGIPISSWVYPENKEKGFYDYGQALEILPFFIEHVGHYPFSKLANVQSKTIFGGMENASAIFYFEQSVTGKRVSEPLLTHEIAHQWFGDYATETDFSHLWLSEGFATYMTDLYFEHKYGTDTLKSMLKQQRKEVAEFAKQKLTPIVDTFTKNYMDLLNPNSYQKGGWVLHMLRRKLGDELFWKCIREYYRQFGGKNANTSDLEHIIEKESHEDQSAFFNQWVFSPGYPKLDIRWRYNERKNAITVMIDQTQATLFEFPLQLGFQENSEIEFRTVTIKQKSTMIVYTLKSKPLLLLADPRTDLLFEGTVKEEKLKKEY
jgi:aminopeptidase N